MHALYNRILARAVLLLLPVFAGSASAKMNIVLLAGQSNMAGRGKIRIPEDTVTYVNIVSLNRDSVWVRARHPLHWDKAEAGVGMGIAFAHELSALLKTTDTIALVPCAAGGTTVDNWLGDDYFGFTGKFNLYSNLINRARRAAKNGPILGMIWHQGESDATAGLYSTYQGKLEKLFKRIRTDLDLPDMPIVAGELGRYLVNNNSYPRWEAINTSINNLKTVLPHYAVASSTGLVSNSDNTHFSSASQNSFGILYAGLFFKLIDSKTSATHDPGRPGFQGNPFTMADRMGLTRIGFYSLSGRHVKTAHASKVGDRISRDGRTVVLKPF
jgi:hypothetical protein